jgi:MAE_28990/MAE_18760-like HEPN
LSVTIFWELEMTQVQTEFNVRVTEIENYLNFIKDMDAGNIQIQQNNNDESIGIYDANYTNDLLRTFKANALLLLYNLMESTVSNAVEAIFDELGNHKISFDLCREELRIKRYISLRSPGSGIICQGS